MPTNLNRRQVLAAAAWGLAGAFCPALVLVISAKTGWSELFFRCSLLSVFLIPIAGGALHRSVGMAVLGTLLGVSLGTVVAGLLILANMP